MAAAYYRRAAERGHAGAQFQLAGRYEDGLGVSEDPLESLTWYMIALDNPDLSARDREAAENRLSTFHSVCALEEARCRELEAEARRRAAAWQAKAD